MQGPGGSGSYNGELMVTVKDPQEHSGDFTSGFYHEGSHFGGVSVFAEIALVL